MCSQRNFILFHASQQTSNVKVYMQKFQTCKHQTLLTMHLCIHHTWTWTCTYLLFSALGEKSIPLILFISSSIMHRWTSCHHCRTLSGNWNMPQPPDYPYCTDVRSFSCWSSAARLGQIQCPFQVVERAQKLAGGFLMKAAGSRSTWSHDLDYSQIENLIWVIMWVKMNIKKKHILVWS